MQIARFHADEPLNTWAVMCPLHQVCSTTTYPTLPAARQAILRGARPDCETWADCAEMGAGATLGWTPGREFEFEVTDETAALLLCTLLGLPPVNAQEHHVVFDATLMLGRVMLATTLATPAQVALVTEGLTKLADLAEHCRQRGVGVGWNLYEPF